MTMRFRSIPQVPTRVDPQTRAFLAALKENFEIIAGMRGSDNVVAELLGYVPANKAGDTIDGDLTVRGAANLGSLGVTEGATLASLSVTGNETVGGTLGVTGATTLASLSVTGNETVGGTLGVTGDMTAAGLTLSGALAVTNIPAFHVTALPYPSYDQALSIDRYIGYTTYNNTVRLNNGSHFNSANGRFTIPVSGIYRFDATLTRSGGNSSVVIRKNGVVISTDSLSYGTDWQTTSAHVVHSFVAGDYVEGVCLARNSTAYAMYAASFSGHRVG